MHTKPSQRMLSRPVLEFVLVPDTSAGRRLRRMLACAAARSGVAVGTWHELVERARAAYFLPVPGCAEAKFAQAMAGVDGAFWQESLAAAPDESALAVRREFLALVGASRPDMPLAELPLAALGDRPRRMMTDFVRLNRLLEGHLPGDLEIIRRLLRAGAREAPQRLHVHRVKGLPWTSRWQDALIEKLNGDAAAASFAPQQELSQQLRACLEAPPSAEANSSLGILQRHLFESDSVTAPVDASAQWVRVRDFYQEAEIVAGMAQQLLAADPTLQPRAIGLLVPASFEYAVALEDAFRLGGLALSGLPSERWQRDLGNEAVFHFLFCRHKPAPAMAMAVCFSSRLMPWSAEDGAQMAQAIMDGNYSPRLPSQHSRQAEQMRDLLLGGDAGPATLAQAVQEFAALLAGGERFSAHAGRAREAAERVRSQLAGAQTIDWVGLRRAVNPELISTGTSMNHNLEGVTVWREEEEPWRSVQHLFVLGFSEGHYPRRLSTSPLFSDEDRCELNSKLDLQLESRAERQLRQRRLFRRQLRAVTGSATFLIPHRNPDGTSANASDSLPFIGRLLSAPPTTPGLIATVDSATDRGRIRNLALADSGRPEGPRDLRLGPLRFNRDLIGLSTDQDGSPRPESPSSLEYLLISPLAWLLRQVQARPLEWAPETADPLLLGKLIHGAFEDIFRPNSALPAEVQITDRAEAALEGVIQQNAPFFRGPHWRVERRELAAGMARAAKIWRAALDDLGATVLGSEQWLEGSALGIAVHGKADAILGIGDNSVLIVDYKWSKSDERRMRMERGFESQASLYREMVQHGGLKPRRAAGSDETGTPALAARLASATDIGIVYFTMRDGVCLSDCEPHGSQCVTGWHTVAGDVAEAAIAKIRERLAQLRRGEVALNAISDRTSLKRDWGVTPHALDFSPLTDLFSDLEG